MTQLWRWHHFHPAHLTRNVGHLWVVLTLNLYIEFITMLFPRIYPEGLLVWLVLSIITVTIWFRHCFSLGLWLRVLSGFSSFLPNTLLFLSIHYPQNSRIDMLFFFSFLGLLCLFCFYKTSIWSFTPLFKKLKIVIQDFCWWLHVKSYQYLRILSCKELRISTLTLQQVYRKLKLNEAGSAWMIYQTLIQKTILYYIENAISEPCSGHDFL